MLLVFYFNSIKVRLKRLLGLIFLMLKQFQFHKGTIKTNIFSTSVLRTKAISIP